MTESELFEFRQDCRRASRALVRSCEDAAESIREFIEAWDEGSEGFEITKVKATR